MSPLYCVCLSVLSIQRRHRLPRAYRHPRASRAWCLGGKKPIIIGRHAFGDQYRAKDYVARSNGRLEMVFTPVGGKPEVIKVYDFENGGRRGADAVQYGRVHHGLRRTPASRWR